MVEGILEKWFAAQNALHQGHDLFGLLDPTLIHGWKSASVIVQLLTGVEENHIEQNSPWGADKNPGVNTPWFSFKKN